MVARPPLKYRPSRRALAALTLIVSAVVCPKAGLARRTGIDASGCNSCHSGGQAPVVTLTASPMNPNAGEPITLTVSVSHTNGTVAGFFLTTAYTNPGTWKAVESGTQVIPQGVTHTMPRTGTGTTTNFNVQWSTTMPTGVNFAVYALSANGDGSTRGDAGGEAHLGIGVGCSAQTYYLDQDGDGVGTNNPLYPTRKECAAVMGFSVKTGDCDDSSATVFPGAPEMCDGKDNDCNGQVDDAVKYQMFCEDKDGDGHGVIGGATKSDCAPSKGYGDCKGDCDDLNAAIYPGASEVCDGRDNDCNGKVDEGVHVSCGTGWCRRNAEGCSTACTPGPPRNETCNDFDDDCDGVVDNGTNAELCGGPGLACVMGQCIPDDGSSAPAGSAGSGSGGSGNGSGGSGNGSGGTANGSGGSGAAHGGTGGCAMIPGGDANPLAALIALALGAALAWARPRDTGRRRRV